MRKMGLHFLACAAPWPLTTMRPRVGRRLPTILCHVHLLASRRLLQTLSGPILRLPYSPCFDQPWLGAATLGSGKVAEAVGFRRPCCYRPICVPILAARARWSGGKTAHTRLLRVLQRVLFACNLRAHARCLPHPRSLVSPKACLSLLRPLADCFIFFDPYMTICVFFDLLGEKDLLLSLYIFVF